jgi:hypothetical protein
MSLHEIDTDTKQIGPKVTLQTSSREVLRSNPITLDFLCQSWQIPGLYLY